MNPFHLLNPADAVRRRVIKCALLGVVVLAVMYPRPAMLARHLERLANLSGLVEPKAAGIAGLARRVQTLAGPKPQSRQVLRAVERVVYAAFPYQYDWDNWGVVNYLPTVEEVLARGRCDCKGHAVVAASVLARLGFAPRLVSDLSHVWVWTPEGETMGPKTTASGHRLVDADDVGERLDMRAVVSRGGIGVDLPARLGFGLHVFPPVRTAIIAAAVWVVLVRVPTARGWAVVGLLAMGAGLVVLGWSSPTPARSDIWAAWAGIGLLLGGMWLARRRVLPAPVATGIEKARTHGAFGPLVG